MKEFQFQGKRVDDGVQPINAGDYCHFRFMNGQQMWLGTPPVEGIGVGCLDRMTITEHEDKTISVEELIQYNKNYPDMPQWKGYLKKGVWIEC